MRKHVDPPQALDASEAMRSEIAVIDRKVREVSACSQALGDIHRRVTSIVDTTVSDFRDEVTLTMRKVVPRDEFAALSDRVRRIEDSLQTLRESLVADRERAELQRRQVAILVGDVDDVKRLSRRDTVSLKKVSP